LGRSYWSSGWGVGEEAVWVTINRKIYEINSKNTNRKKSSA